MATQTEASTELYLITPEKIELEKFADQLAAILQEVPVACLQIRLPHATNDELKQAVQILAPLAWEKEVAVLLCDQPQLVKELDLDGVHLEMDASTKAIKSARKILGEDRSIGVSCRNSRHDAMLAGEAGADYVSFGPLFPSPTKGMPAEEGVFDALRWWVLMMELPCVAVGGLTIDNVATALETGAEFIAPLSGIWSHPEGPVQAAKAFYQQINNFK